MQSVVNKDNPINECRELLLGTWLAIAILADALIDNGTIKRDALMDELTAVRDLCRKIDGRDVALAGVLSFLERLDGLRASRPAKHGTPRPRAANG